MDELKYIITHAFLPPKLPQEHDQSRSNDYALCQETCDGAKMYQSHLPEYQQTRWAPIVRMLENLRTTQEFESLLVENIESSIADMKLGDVRALLIRAQNAGVIMRKSPKETIFELFEVSPPASDVMKTPGKMLCSYPGPAIAVPFETVDNHHFRHELASFLVQMNVDVIDPPTTIKAGSEVIEERDTGHPRYITQLLTGILRGMGRIAEVTRIQKRIGDDVLWDSTKIPWRRSSIWLLIRVALQTSLYSEIDSEGHGEYKAFMVFLLTRILRRALEHDLPSDLLFCMRAKISRRLYKIGHSSPDFVLKEVHDAGALVEKKLQARWLEVQKNQASSPPWDPASLNILDDTRLSLPKSRDYLSQVLRQAHSSSVTGAFLPSEYPRLRDDQHVFRFFDESRLVEAFRNDTVVALADFEILVQDHLDDWVSQNLYEESTCVTVAACITRYADKAVEFYGPNPEDQSLMFLTIFGLWVALDKAAVAQCPLLREYSPEVPLHLLETFLIRKSKSLERLKLIRDHLHQRHHHARSGFSIFSDNTNCESFAVRYFEGSGELRRLKERIELDASEARQRKRAELKSKNDRYETLMKQVAGKDHEYSDYRGYWRHAWYCKKCSFQKEAQDLSIECHEWPLSINDTEAKATVFELQCPPVFRTWRTATYEILFDLCKAAKAISTSSADPPVLLEGYHDLQKYTNLAQMPRITYASTTKSFQMSHYANPKIPTVESSILVNNGLNFRLFDKVKRSWAADPFTRSSLVPHCTLQLPTEGAYATLQYTVQSTIHTSNEILANQSECPNDLSIHEFIAFGTLRSGSRLQWLNIVRELPARSLSFHREEVHILLMQAAWQVGPLSQDDAAEWHVELCNPDYCDVVLSELENLLLSVEANWLEGVSLKTIIMLTSRLLTSARDHAVEQKAYALLRKARSVTFGWMRQLVEKLKDGRDDKDTIAFQLRVCEMALTCRGTFDVDPGHLHHLFVSADDVAVFVECAIRVYDNTPAKSTHASRDFLRLLARDKRLAHTLEFVSKEQCRIHEKGLDSAVSAIWPGYCSGKSWQQMPKLNDRWFTTETSHETGKESQTVHLNLLTGRLLVNGKPLGRLPENIVQHPTYVRVFAQKVLDVIPADMPGMEFMTLSRICGNQVFFAMRDEGRSLIIRARLNSETFELIPHERLTGDLPIFFVRDYVHWLHLPNGGDSANCDIELRPMESLWKSSPNNWHIQFSIDQHSKMYKDSSSLLLDMHKPTFIMISKLLKPLESAEYLTVTCSPDGHSLAVKLPRFRLSFFLNGEEELESKHLPGMVVDSTQSTGTMFGLSNQLVLRPNKPIAMDLPRSRRVIIPYGHVTFERSGVHVSVNILPGSENRVQYHEYEVDTDLGCLVGKATLISRLYKTYLHAVTSHCLPDPLTARTGTEEALSELSSAGCWSFQKLGPDEIRLLDRIGALTPRRGYYPAHLEVMQTVNWSNLGFLSQHHEFIEITQSILEYAQTLCIFYENEQFPSNSSSRSSYLRNRASLRNRVFYPHEYAGHVVLTNVDIEYRSRDLAIAHGDEETRVFDVSAMVQSWPSELFICQELLMKIRAWGRLSGPLNEVKLSYTRRWLKPDLPNVWISLYNLCRDMSGDRKRFELTFTLAAMTYDSPQYRELIPTILAFATIAQFSGLDPPSWSSYHLSEGFEPDKDKLLELIRHSSLPLNDSPSANLAMYCRESGADFDQRRSVHYRTHRDAEADELAENLIKQWPCETPHYSSSVRSSASFLDVTDLMPKVNHQFQCWYQNRELGDHVQQVQSVLNRAYLPDSAPNQNTPYIFTPYSNRIVPQSPVTFDRLLQRDAPESGPCPIINLTTPDLFLEPQTADTEELQSLLSEFQCAPNFSRSSALYRRYGMDLAESRATLDGQTFLAFPDVIPYSMETLLYLRDESKKHLQRIYNTIRQSLLPSNPTESAVFTAGQWPRLTMKSLLGTLASTSIVNLTGRWRPVLLLLARAFLAYQRCQRLVEFAFRQRCEDFFKELENMELDQIIKTEYSDWLLIQIESNFLVRSLQDQVAKEMISPTLEQNAILQLNMGEGKSSVVVPLVTAALADGQKLTRVVALKPLARQTFQLLVERLSGLANRRIFYLPFSRNVRVDGQHAQRIQDLYEMCLRERGILVVQPEHILSFKLMGVERLLSSENRQAADTLLMSQRWLDMKSRDVLDESDEILRVQYQLIYTVGEQTPLEGHPDRWITTQQIFSLVRKHILQVQEQYPHGVEAVSSRQGSFALFRILEDDAGQELVRLVVDDVMNGALTNFTLGTLPKRARQAVLQFISIMNIDDRECARVIDEHCRGTSLWNGLLLLRGLLVHGVLVYVLKERRWRVDYGLDPSRTLLAVPYRAKDVPALRAEFGHPDVAIALTCLSYYYGGLTDDQLLLCFELLFRLDNPKLEYEKWIRDIRVNVPIYLRDLAGVNTEDPEHCEKYLIPLFSKNHTVVDFYLSRVVFPKQAKEYPHKLSTSGWDLATETKQHVTTGFSGTNDNRYLLPTTITQCDPIFQSSTNAKVLTYLLRPENDCYLCAQGQIGERASIPTFFELLASQKPKVSVLLDVGAQMLELKNKELVEYWLSLEKECDNDGAEKIQAAIFFSDTDELTVLTRDGTAEPFVSSPFNQQLDKCLVYLDDAHTRGTDLKLPRDARAAVTVGPKVTKDRLLQGCMRMRKLGHGQSVMFIAPPETDTAIRKLSNKPFAKIKVLDILRWAMLETCSEIESHIPHWVQQGVDYDRRKLAWLEFSPSDDSSLKTLKASWLQQEARNLEEMYGLAPNDTRNIGNAGLNHAAFNNPSMRARLEMLGISSLGDPHMDEEQEREISHEIEQERQVERPPKARAAVHQVHQHVRDFIATGTIPYNSPGFISAIKSLEHTAPDSQGQGIWSSQLLVTKDFATTIQGSFDSPDYLRPINWIVSSASAGILVVLSPYEVNNLLGDIRRSEAVYLHIYTPRVTQSMKCFDDLRFYSIPSVPLSWAAPATEMRQLALLAGQLYLADYEAYRLLCLFLGVYTKKDQLEGIEIQLDGFITPEHRREPTKSECRFTESPLPFLKELIGLRRKGMGYLSTHMGQILSARLLKEGDFH